jgi:3-hydroxyisobutyrate dehydrogenase-like beta-hydroxyacid dehydrogenase
MKIGFIGLGRMGYHMARNLAAAGHEVAAYDVLPEAVARVAETPGIRAGTSVADVARDADVVCSSLPSPQSVEEIALDEGGLADSMREGAIYIDLSTNAPAVVRKLSPILAEKGIKMLDAPVAGGTGGAEKATLSIMVGGDEAVYNEMQPVLSALGNKLFYCGDIGAGSVVKLCNNIAAQGYNMVLGEVLTMGVKAGVELKTLATVIGSSTGTSQRLINAYPTGLFKRAFLPAPFSLILSNKDTRLALELSHEVDVPMAVGELVYKDQMELLERGLGELSTDALVQMQEERAGVVLQIDEKDLPLQFMQFQPQQPAVAPKKDA